MSQEDLMRYWPKLRKRLDSIGNQNVPITKTMLWQYSVELGIGYEDMPEMFFYNTPPVNRSYVTKQSDRALVTSTNSQWRILQGVLEGVDERRKMLTEEPQVTHSSTLRIGEDDELITETVIRSLQGREKQDRLKRYEATINRSERYVAELRRRIDDQVFKEMTDNIKQFDYCVKVGRFWPEFFAEENFLDFQSLSIPRKLITTGFMRNHSRGYGETLLVDERLKQISKEWEVPLYYVPLAAP